VDVHLGVWQRAVESVSSGDQFPKSGKRDSLMNSKTAFFFFLMILSGIFAIFSEPAWAPPGASDASAEQTLEAPSKTSPALDLTLDEVRRQMAETADVRPEKAPREMEDHVGAAPSLFSVIRRLIYGLLFVIVILITGLYAMRRFLNLRAPGPSRYMNVISRMALSPRSSLHLVRVMNRRLLIGEGPEGVRLIAEIPEGEQAPLPSNDSGSSKPMTRAEFRKRLQEEEEDVRKGTLPDRFQSATRLCREYLGRFRQGGSKNVQE